MLYYEQVWKPITLKKYNKLIKGKSELEIMFDSRLDKRLKNEIKYKDIPTGIGLVERLLDNKQVKYSPEDYDYFISTGKYNMVFMGSQKSCDAFINAMKI